MMDGVFRWNPTLVDEPLLHVGVVLVLHADCGRLEFGGCKNDYVGEHTVDVVHHVAGSHCE